ncbi:ABC transporter permease [Pseudonocardia sp. NPDC049154]|uniref:ABC transporter permease n=1 Tax=Pseudonocardia sp. NPDC049154 TaxID=3155501 RepID=UPI0033EC55B0
MTEVLARPDGSAAEPAAPRTTILRRFLRDRIAVVAVAYLVALVVVAGLAPLLAPADPLAQDLGSRLTPPGPGHPLGADELGRDQLSRLLYGARVSLLAALQAVAIGAVVGVPLGVLAGFSGRTLDAWLGRLMDVLMSVPGIILALTVVAVLGRDITTAMIAVGIILVPRFHRVARAATTDLRHETFIEASRTIGCSRARILGTHVLPNILPVLVVQLSIMLGVAVTAEASLSFLGMGVRPPAASWGSMLNSAFANVVVAPYLVYAPGLAITLTVLAFSLAGDGLRKAVGRRGAADRSL